MPFRLPRPSLRRSPAPQRPARSARTRLHAEPLEPRLLMAADADLTTAIADDVALTFDWHPAAHHWSVSVEVPHTLASEHALRSWIRQVADQHYGELFGTTYQTQSYFAVDYDIDWGSIRPTLLRTTANDALSSGIDSISLSDATNVQVQGVDEADLVESDGERLFVLRNRELLVFQANGVDQVTLLSRVQLDSPATRMFLHGDRLAIVSEDSGYSSYRHSRNATTTITLLDVEDGSSPAFVQKTEVDGKLLDLRSVDGKVVLLTSPSSPHSRFALPGLQSRVVGKAEIPAPETGLTPSAESLLIDDAVESSYYFQSAPRRILTHQYESRSEYLDRVEEEFVNRFLIGHRSYDLNGNIVRRVSLTNTDAELRSWKQGQSEDRLVASVFDMHANAPGPTDTQLLRAEGNTQVYATEESIYLFSHATRGYNNVTNIVKLSLDADSGQLSVAARGRVDGRMLNQFAADERDGVLRVVTTDNGGWSRGQAVYTLRAEGGRLKVVGEITGIAPNELLHSVSFQADELHFVTYRKVDPLFVVDLSDPEAPVITGELKIPGYSELLIDIGEDHLLGIGRGAENGWFAEMQLSIFDVTDPANPTRTHLHSIQGDRNTSTEATGNRWTNGDGDHHALTYLPEEGLLALPVQLESSGWRGRSSQDEPLFNNGVGGLLVFRIDAETGIQQVASIEHDTMIRRTVRVGDRLYAISSSQVTAHDIADPSTTIDSYAIQHAPAALMTTLRQYISADDYRQAFRALAQQTPVTVAPAPASDHVFQTVDAAPAADATHLLLAVDRAAHSKTAVNPFDDALGESKTAPYATDQTPAELPEGAVSAAFASAFNPQT